MYLYNHHWQKHTGKPANNSTAHNFLSLDLYDCTTMLYEPHAGKIYYSKQVLSVIARLMQIISKIAVPK